MRQQNQVTLTLMPIKNYVSSLNAAKTYNVPKHIIDRAIEKAKGAGDETYSELRYEGFGPSGSMVIVDTLTNNVNRYSSPTYVLLLVKRRKHGCFRGSFLHVRQHSDLWICG